MYKDISILLVKITGVWLIIYAVIGLATNIAYIFNEFSLPWWEYILLASLPIVVPAFIGLAFFTFPATVTNKIVGGEKLSESPPAVFFDIERVALSVLGVFLLFRTVSDAVAHVTYLVTANQLQKAGEWFGVLDPERVAAIVATAAEFIFAVWLIFGSTGLVLMFNKIRGR